MKKLLTILIITYLLFTINSTAVEQEKNENKKLLKIGVLLPLSGEYENLGQSFLKAIQLALYDISEKNIKIYPKDSGANPLDAYKSAKEFESLEDVKIFWRKQRPSISEHALNERVNFTIKQLESGKYGFKWDVQGIAKAKIRADGEYMWDCVRKIKCPTLLIRGAESDILQHDVATQMIKENHNIALIEIPDATHYVHDDQLELFNREVGMFYQRI